MEREFLLPGNGKVHDFHGVAKTYDVHHFSYGAEFKPYSHKKTFHQRKLQKILYSTITIVCESAYKRTMQRNCLHFSSSLFHCFRHFTLKCLNKIVNHMDGNIFILVQLSLDIRRSYDRLRTRKVEA